MILKILRTSKCKTFSMNQQIRSLSSSNNSVKGNVTHFQRIFSGIQPSGTIHLGNYMGAIAQWIKYQNENFEVILEIADLHSITVPQNPKTLKDKIFEMAATLLACGIDHKKVLLFQQSKVHTHSELSWLLGCMSTMARLSHLTAYKEKASAMKEVPLGIFIYPILQAADILAYKATHVPVGEDQSQHINLTRELARLFNNRYGAIFPIPKALLTDGKYARVKSLRNPLKKMSKSDPDPKSRILITDPPDVVMGKVKKAMTDHTSQITFDPVQRPGVSNLITIHSFVSNKTVEEICEEYSLLNTEQYKVAVGEAIVAHLRPIQEKYKRLLTEDRAIVRDMLEDGANRARQISEATVKEAKNKLGLEFDYGFEK